MRCHHYDAGRCHSCTLLEVAYPTQVADKERHVRELLEPVLGPAAAAVEWLPPVESVEGGFRNKGKMVVTGTVEAPVLGILGAQPMADMESGFAHAGVDLTDCPLYPPILQAAFGPLGELITRARLQPYDLTPARGRVTPRDAARRGELKHLLVTMSPDGELLVRLVVRSQEPVARLRKHLPWLQEALPNLAVLSVNVQPEHKAVLEGDLEIVLTERQTLPMRLDGVTLHLRPQSFFQTNTEVAAALYRQAVAWVDEVAPASLWDLYCGVGGFALHCAAPGRQVTGIEISAEAVASAEVSRGEIAAASPAGADAMAGVRFAAGDATAFALAAAPDDVPELVIVNPPRRGVGPELAAWLEASGARHVLYSSCNAVTLAKDLEHMPSLRPVRARLLDMFPQTRHYEVLTLLERV
ncbi:23S rRNA (uracil(747)-C(5))-methyltransferase RlmC [Xylanimonas oleitrophica]|uniref:23S rRNA (Uracil(747)-C(5))-methyltransferase RlmC n=1 Tax=Xylanimonas oleitrophica TaxID=2607479 RepID=A0A2W5XSY9_9MICO|nr:23S rRNA (uracil(747)-C(5))-methyltransferase RlmC [Xylanimonas oleitrophica]PZR53088.1 23S rRNA (uracil(747)-C(5))-methyltransferase RlmC [Xylanimonas oleitrophica]